MFEPILLIILTLVAVGIRGYTLMIMEQDKDDAV